MTKKDIDIDEISELIALSSDKEQIKGYLKSLLTPSEVKGIALRWEIFKGLYEGKTQRTVAKELKASLCNVTRGARELKQTDSAVRKFLKEYFKK